MKKLHLVMEQLVGGVFLSKGHKDHALQGEWQDFRDCHIEGDWVLIYQIGYDENGSEIVTFHATDNHSNLFS